jgi:hypothetical protein
VSTRDFLNKNPIVAAAFAGAAILFVVVTMLIRGGAFGTPQAALPKRFFTVDDGKTWFADTIDKIPPFTTAEGKTAYGVQVVQCGKGAPYATHLERFTEAQKKKLAEMFADEKQRMLAIEATLGGQSPPQVKRPSTGDSGWTDPTDEARYDAIAHPRCPDGSTPQPVGPPN